MATARQTIDDAVAKGQRPQSTQFIHNNGHRKVLNFSICIAFGSVRKSSVQSIKF